MVRVRVGSSYCGEEMQSNEGVGAGGMFDVIPSVHGWTNPVNASDNFFIDIKT